MEEGKRNGYRGEDERHGSVEEARKEIVTLETMKKKKSVCAQVNNHVVGESE